LSIQLQKLTTIQGDDYHSTCAIAFFTRRYAPKNDTPKIYIENKMI